MRKLMRHAAVGFVLGLGAATAAAQSNDPPVGSAAHTGSGWLDQQRALDVQLGRERAALMRLLSEAGDDGARYVADGRLLAALQAQQAAWEQYRGHECELIGALSGAISPWQSARALECERNLTWQRWRRTRDSVRCVERLAAAERRYGLQACLYQLAPLAVPLER